MPCIAQGRRKVLALFLVAILSSVGLMVLGPVAPAYATAGTDDYPSDLKSAAQDSKTDPWGFYNRECTSFVAWRLNNDNGVPFKNQASTGIYGNATTWKDRATAEGIAVDNTPTVGAVAWYSFGHVAWVESVSSDGKSVTVEDYNYDYDGKYATHTQNTSYITKFLHFGGEGGGASGGGDSGGGSTSTPQIFALKRTTDPNGVRQVYAGTNTAVTEGWWIPGGDGMHTHEVINIAQHNIVGFDKVNLPGGTQAVYAAVSDGVWESWWKPDGTSGQSKIISGLSGVKGVIAYNDTESGQFVHHLYILAGNGPYEAWWKDGGDGIHLSLLTSITGGVTFTMSIGPDGAMQLYVAVPTWVYEVWWHPGLNDIHVGTVINIAQGDIRSLSKGDNLSDGGQLLYTGTSTTAWQSYWNTGTGISNGTIATSQVNLVQVKKTVTSGTHQLYVATGDHVQEYWWNSTGSGGGELIRIPQNNIGAIDKVNDGATQDLYTGAGNWVWETWWGGGYSPSSTAIFSVAH
ncbi:CHAP domain-containing protein [Streptomyces sp. NPDC093970]|uniref:CHAP domain-containing protein n=1 Tax=Streptomyces sp. NPDC093970 TaxID=3155076 RepID=UPI003439B09F